MTTGRTALPAILLTLTAFSAFVSLSAELGTEHLEAEGAQAMPIKVYAAPDSGRPALDDETAAVWNARLDTVCAAAVREAPATLSGPGWTADVTLRAVPEDLLPRMNLNLLSGDWPNSAWEPQIMLNSAAERALREAAGRAGCGSPGRAGAWPGGRAACESAGVKPVECAVAGTLEGDETIVWINLETYLYFLENNKEYCALYGLREEPARIDVYPREAAGREALLVCLTEKGYLAADPAADWAEAVKKGRVMSHRWAAAAILLAAGFLLAAREKPNDLSLARTAAFALICAAAGLTAALAVTQAAMLLRWDTVVASQARYLPSLPRALSAAAGCAALAFAARALPLKTGTMRRA